MHFVVVAESSPMMEGRPALELNLGLSSLSSRLSENSSVADALLLTVIEYSSGEAVVVGDTRQSFEQLSRTEATSTGKWFGGHNPAGNGEAAWPDFSSAIESVLRTLIDEPTVILFVSASRSRRDASRMVSDLCSSHGQLAVLQLFVDSPEAAAPPPLPSRAVEAFRILSEESGSEESGDEICQRINVSEREIARWKHLRRRLEEEAVRHSADGTFGIPVIPGAYQIVLRGIMFREFFEWLATQFMDLIETRSETAVFDLSGTRHFLRHALKSSETQ